MWWKTSSAIDIMAGVVISILLICAAITLITGLRSEKKEATINISAYEEVIHTDGGHNIYVLSDAKRGNICYILDNSEIACVHN